MSPNTKTRISLSLIGITVILVIFTVIFSIKYALSAYSCHVRWSDSSFDSKYSFLSGCLVNKDGHWIPAKNLRL